MKIHRVLFLLPLIAAASPVAWSQETEDEWERPKVQLNFSGATTFFRGGEVDGFLPFQPDGDAPTASGGISFRLFRRLALELDVAGSFGRSQDAFEDPDNVFFSGGFQIPLLTQGRVVPYVTLGGGVVSRRPAEEFDETFEDAFDIRETDPTAYAGAGLEFRLTKLLGVRADYRYFRIFPDDVDDLDIERDSYGAHRITGGVTFSF